MAGEGESPVSLRGQGWSWGSGSCSGVTRGCSRGRAVGTVGLFGVGTSPTGCQELVCVGVGCFQDVSEG